MKVAATAALVACGAAFLAAQQSPQQRPPVFRGESVLVTVDAYPQRDGKIVEGLKAEDFQILEDGKPQAIENLEFVRVEPSLSESTRRDPNSVGEMLREASDPHNRVFVVFLDQLHVQLDGSFRTRRPLADALNRIIAPNDLFAMMTQNTDPRALTFGRRLMVLEEQLTKFWDWGERNRITGDPNDPMESRLKSCYECKPGSQTPCPNWYVSDNGQSKLLSEALIERRREDRTLAALEGLVNHVRGLREARTVALTITEGWRLFPPSAQIQNEAAAYGPQRPQVGSVGGRITMGSAPNGVNNLSPVAECQTELLRLALLDNDRRFKDLLTDANRANVSFYPVNPGGLQVFDTPISSASQPSLLEDSSRIRRRTDAMMELAHNTDGIAVVNTNDLSSGLKRVIDDVSAYYLLGYYSTNTTHDGRYRRIEVKTKAPGTNIRARRGYYAPSNKVARDSFIPAPKGPEPPAGLDDALGELGRLRVSADVYVRGGIAGDRALIAVELSSSRAAATPWSNGADVQVTVTPEGGTSMPAVTVKLEAYVRGALVSVPLGTPAASARIVAKMSSGGETVEETAEIKRSVAGLLGEAIVYRGRPAATSPLRPVADLQLRRTERVHVEWAMSGDLDSRSARLLSRTAQPLAIPVAITERETGGRKVLASDLNLAPLTAGEYVIEVTASRGAETAVRLIAFRVLQ